MYYSSSSQWFIRHQESTVIGSSGIARSSGTGGDYSLRTPPPKIMNLKDTQSQTKFPFIWLKNLKFDKQEKQTLSFKICILPLMGLCPATAARHSPYQLWDWLIYTTIIVTGNINGRLLQTRTDVTEEQSVAKFTKIRYWHSDTRASFWHKSVILTQERHSDIKSVILTQERHSDIKSVILTQERHFDTRVSFWHQERHSDFNEFTAEGQKMVHTIPPCCHHWHLSTYATVVPRYLPV